MNKKSNLPFDSSNYKIMIAGVICIDIGFIVISNAVSVIGNLKVYQNLVLRILGFEKSNIMKLIIFESLILFLPVIRIVLT